MKNAIRRQAGELGFDACHFTTAHPPASRGHFQQWLAKGWHGGMEYLARNAAKRLEPEKVLAAARSVVTLAINYSPASDDPNQIPLPNGQTGSVGEGQSEGEPFSAPITSPVHGEGERISDSNTALHGQIARYAQYQDYHDVLREPLTALAEFIDEQGGPGTQSLWYVDTGPLLERDLAQRSGLGFIGKHTNLIHRRLGNWIFLAEIITTAEIEPDVPEQNRCGTCERCIGACPTAAIIAPFQLDARRCISYLTIELKGAIPLELRPLIGNRIYGCDDCLAVCPWNRFAREGGLMKHHIRKDLAVPDLVELLGLDEAAFRQRFAGTPIIRTKRRGLLRNVCVALGNVGDERALPALERAAADPEPLIAEHARWAIAAIIARRTKS
jgi:epoxyqueuosine reductase